MKTFYITWIAGGIYHHFIIEAESKEEAKHKFYNMASDRALVTNCDEITESKSQEHPTTA